MPRKRVITADHHDGIRPLKRPHLEGVVNTSTTSNRVAVFAWGKTEPPRGLNNDDDDEELTPVYAQALHGESVRQVVCGSVSQNGYVLTTDGSLRQWGPSKDQGGWALQSHKKRALSSDPILELNDNASIASISSSDDAFAAITTTGAVYTWGDNAGGRLGHGAEGDVASPKLVEALKGISIQQFQFAYGFSVALTAEGEIYTWGSNKNGGTGNGELVGTQLVPRKITGLERISSISADGGHAAAVSCGGKVYTWGLGGNGRLGHGSELFRSTPTLVTGLNHKIAVQVYCGGGHTAAVTRDGLLYCWGCNDLGQIGDGTTEERLIPVLVKGLHRPIVKVVLSYETSLAITDIGEIYTWGASNGHRGSDKGAIAMPTQIECLIGQHVVDAVPAGNCHMIVLVDHSKLVVDDSMPIASALTGMLNNEEFSDVTFVVGDKKDKVYAHRVILIQKSDYYRTMFRSGMREATEQLVQVPDTNIKVFRLLMQYLYTDKVVVDIDMAIDLYKVADLHGLMQLKDICCSTIRKKLTPENATGLLREATEGQAPAIRSICFQFVLENFKDVSQTAALASLPQPLLVEVVAEFGKRLDE
eukprot:CAMPEP_0172476334 /NCGR_PEP_ID=MMETSP1065-20121228/70326_1 /TAXON_ID=265537 /ORGANISM="Amphiprora paludosa, Strain CCMP125" /LENGTH=588 /DNA_ID=CAMNT_0013234555 /DNA_START=52 /DNA_END=1818 /DNA_ORIENTATION=-